MSKNKNYSSYYNKKETTEVSYDGKTEEIQTEELEETKEEPKVEEAPKQPKKVIVTGSKLVNLRSGASKNSLVIAVLTEGKELTVVDESNEDWFKVTDGNGTGYMMSQYLKEKA